MPKPKDAFEETFPCEFYEPAALFDPDLMYTIPEIGRLLQGVEPDADIDPDTEAVLIDWAIPWVMAHADDMVIAEPLTEDGPGYYGVDPAAADSANDEADSGEESTES